MENNNKYKKIDLKPSPFSTYKFPRHHHTMEPPDVVLPFTPVKKICFNYCRGCCTLAAEFCEYRHPETEKEFNEELEKLSKIKCKYGDACSVTCCLYKHTNRDRFVPLFRQRATTPTQSPTMGAKPIQEPRYRVPCIRQAKSEIRKSIGFDADDEVDHLLITLRQISGLGICDKIQVPDDVQLFLLKQPRNLPLTFQSEYGDVELFLIINSCSYKTTPTTFDLRFQNPSCFQKLLDHIQVIAKRRHQKQQSERIWITISSAATFSKPFENLLEASSLDFALGKFQLDKEVINCYSVELKSHT